MIESVPMLRHRCRFTAPDSQWVQGLFLAGPAKFCADRVIKSPRICGEENQRHGPTAADRRTKFRTDSVRTKKKH
jgi:hypothetical protein